MIILTSGCSFTHYKWPTWANYLKEWSTPLQPYTVVNVAEAGIDNSIVAYRVLDYMNQRVPIGKFEKPHHPKNVGKVCVMWTGHERYCPQYKDIVTHNDLQYVGKHLHPTERLRNLAMCIDAVHLLCESKNIQCYSFFYFELSKQEQKYLKFMTSGPWILNHTAFDTYRTNRHPVFGNDTHPTPYDQWIFARDVVVPTIGLPDWYQGQIPKKVKEHEKAIRENLLILKHTSESLTKYAHHDRPEYLNEHMDPFATNLYHIDANSSAVKNTENAFHDKNAQGIDTKKDKNWFDSLMERLHNL